MHVSGSANNFKNQSSTNLYLSQVPILAPPHYVSHPKVLVGPFNMSLM